MGHLRSAVCCFWVWLVGRVVPPGLVLVVLVAQDNFVTHA